MDVWNVMCVCASVHYTWCPLHLQLLPCTPSTSTSIKDYSHSLAIANSVQHLQIAPCVWGHVQWQNAYRSTVQKVPPRFLVPNEWKCLLVSSCLPSLLTIANLKITFVCSQLPKGARSNGGGHACGTGGTDCAPSSVRTSEGCAPFPKHSVP